MPRSVVILFLACSPAFTQEVKFDYAGETGLLSGVFFGRQIPAATPVLGTLSLDPVSAATHFFSDSRVGYHQQIPDGLTLSISLDGAPLLISADEFLVIVSNDIASPLGGTIDAVEFSFQTGFAPSITTPLEINGNPVSTADINRDALINIDDHGALSAAFGSAAADADLNRDQAVNAADYVVLRDGGGGLLGTLSIVFESFSDPFDTIDLASLDLAKTLDISLAGDFVSAFNPISDDIGVNAIDFFVDLTRLESARHLNSVARGLAMEATAVPEPASAIQINMALAVIAGVQYWPRSRRRANHELNELCQSQERSER